jgi:hypothetical protein
MYWLDLSRRYGVAGVLNARTCKSVDMDSRNHLAEKRV